MDLLIFSGQSNMQGQTESLPMHAPIKNAYEYRLLNNELIPLVNPVGEDIEELLLGSHLGRGSLVPSFVTSYIEDCKKDVTAVHVAKGATILAQWLKDSEQGEKRYEKAIEKIKAAKNKAGDCEKVYFIWLQGESDALAGTSKQEYKQKLKKFKDDLKKDCAIDKFMIIKVGYFASNFGGKRKDEEIMLAQEEICNDDSDFLMLTDITAQLSTDTAYINPEAVGHYSNAAMELIGGEAGKAAAEYRLTE